MSSPLVRSVWTEGWFQSPETGPTRPDLGGRGQLDHALIGAVLIGVIRNALNLHNVEVFYQMVAIGLIIVLADEADVLRSHLEARARVHQARRPT